MITNHNLQKHIKLMDLNKDRIHLLAGHRGNNLKIVLNVNPTMQDFIQWQ